MRIIIVSLGAALLSACAGNPASTPDSKVVINAPRGIAHNAPVDDAAGAVDAQALANAKKLGFTPVNQDGEVLYCRSEVKTGSRVQRETVCLTLAEIDSLRERTQRQLGDFERQVPPPAGR